MENNCVSDPPRKLDRKTVERNRRIQMKGLIHELTSLVPPQHFKPSKRLIVEIYTSEEILREEFIRKSSSISSNGGNIECITKKSLNYDRVYINAQEMLSQQDQLNQVAAYIKQLRERVEKLNKTKEQISMSKFETKGTHLINSAIPSSKMPVVRVREIGSSLEVVLVSGLRKNFALHEVIQVLEEQGVEVVSVSVSTMNNNIFHILHAQVKVSRFGVDVSVIYNRLHELFK